MIDLSARQIGMLREGGAGDRRPRRSGRVIFRVVLIVMGMMVFVILVRFPRWQGYLVKLHHGHLS